jgi:hypothetical protein
MFEEILQIESRVGIRTVSGVCLDTRRTSCTSNSHLGVAQPDSFRRVEMQTCREYCNIEEIYCNTGVTSLPYVCTSLAGSFLKEISVIVSRTLTLLRSQHCGLGHRRSAWSTMGLHRFVWNALRRGGLGMVTVSTFSLHIETTADTERAVFPRK